MQICLWILNCFSVLHTKQFLNFLIHNIELHWIELTELNHEHLLSICFSHSFIFPYVCSLIFILVCIFLFFQLFFPFCFSASCILLLELQLLSDFKISNLSRSRTRRSKRIKKLKYGMFHFNKYQTTSERVSEFYSSKSTRKEKRIESVGKREKESWRRRSWEWWKNKHYNKRLDKTIVHLIKCIHIYWAMILSWGW